MQGYNLQQMALHEVEAAKDLVHLRVEVAVLCEESIQVTETVLAMLVLYEHLNAVQLLRLSHTLYSKQQVVFKLANKALLLLFRELLKAALLERVVLIELVFHLFVVIGNVAEVVHGDLLVNHHLCF